jgi:transketolase
MHAEERAVLGADIRRTVIEQSYRAGVGHIGSSLSISDLVAAVLGEADLDGGGDRDRVILSKGHAALALYAGLHHLDRMEPGAIETYCGDGSLLGVHPEHGLDGIDFCTGSLGQGLSLGAGAALAAKRLASARRVFVIMSDAELNEGSIWEASMFAAQHGLDNLTLLIDLNGQQALGYTAEVLDLGAVEDKFTDFGWDAARVPGHDHEALAAALVRPTARRPRALVAATTFGYGVSFMESKIEWHYMPLDERTHQQALADLEAKAPA